MPRVVNTLSTSTRQILEELNFDQLFAQSEPKRVLRSKTVRGPALGIESYRDGMYYLFNVKAFPSTERRRHKGYIKFFKPEDPDTPLEKVDCEVDCDCLDYRYTWAWANAQRNAGRIGRDSLNQAWDQAPRKKNPQVRPGLCKHLLALRNYLYGQNAQFPPSDDVEDPSNPGARASLVKKASERYDMQWLAKHSNQVAFDQETGEPLGQVVEYDTAGFPVAYRDSTGTVVRPGDLPSNQPGGPTAGSALDTIQRQELELQRRQQIRAQGGDPDAPEAAGELPPGGPLGGGPVEPEVGPDNPQTTTNPINPSNPTTRNRPPRRPESLALGDMIVKRMDAQTIKKVQEMVDAAEADVAAAPAAAAPQAGTPAPGGTPEKSQSQTALDHLARISSLLAELVQLQQTPEPPAEAPAEPALGAASDEPAPGPALPKPNINRPKPAGPLG